MNRNDEWYTPKEVIDRVHAVLGEIDLDPASNPFSNTWIKAKNIYTKEDNGLTKVWEGKVFTNPPYSAGLISKFTKKLHDEFMSGRCEEFICLTNQGTDTQWNSWLRKFTQAFTIGRLKFVKPDGTNDGGTSRGQCFTYAGPNTLKFMEVFNDGAFSYVANAHLLNAGRILGNQEGSERVRKEYADLLADD